MQEDLLQFKDYSINLANVDSTPAEISINSSTNIAGKRPSSELYDMSENSGQMTSVSLGRNDNNRGVFVSTSSSVSSSGVETNTINIEDNNSNVVSFLTLEYYQRYFNVDTSIVLERIAYSMIPKRKTIGVNYLRSNIGQNPDLYGPFWIMITLIFSIAISGNLASYLQLANDSYHWRYNFHLVSYAATSIFMYVNLIPIFLWTIFKYSLKPIQEGFETESADYTPSLLSLMCVYGYSLAIYIPVSILWVIQISLLQWLLVIAAALLSGSGLILILTPALRNSRLSLFLVMGILAAHFLLAVGFMLFFFHVPSETHPLQGIQQISSNHTYPS